ncbi:MAG: fasciclin domain-containing protein [Prolixibacteraceae bacterium]|jgi:uncharacterized surface protein with fasciclin (FAS1) repeats|nr:fasciclin domain-containing protein [Prolixibacteraceae bacterium]
MQRFINYLLVLSMLCCTLFFTSCEKEMEKYYETPDWLKGNAYELLQSEGNYTIFLEAIELAGFSELVGGKGIITVMAPSDEAFSKFLSEKGYGLVSDIPDDELKKIVGYHLVYYSFNKEQFANYQPNGSGMENPLEKGLYYKHRTKALNPVTTETDPVTEEEVKVIHKELFLPVLSENFFNTKQIDAKSNYEYFFEGSTWTGADGGFNVASASVDEYALVTDNGYLYKIDRVLEPLETIHKSLRNKGNYSDFLSMYDRFSNFWYDEDATTNYGGGDSLYVHMHSGLPRIASEWPYNGEGTLPDYANLAALAKDAFSVFVPDNDALSGFFDKYWATYYPSIDSVYFLQVGYLLDNHVYSEGLAFPEEIQNNTIKTTYGTPVSFDTDADVTISQICANGAYYGLSDVQVPAMFKNVTSPAFQSPEYRMFLFMMARSGMVLPLTGKSINYTVFYPSDEVIKSSGYYDLDIQYYDPNPKKYQDDVIRILDGTWVELSTGAMRGFIDDHTATDVLTEVSGVKIYKTRTSLNYLYAKDDSIASTRMFNEETGFVSMSRLGKQWENGETFNVDTLLLRNKIPFKAEISSADEYAYLSEFEEFSKLLMRAGFLPINNPLDFILENFMVFIPSNEAILNAPEGVIPENAQELAEYLKYYFVPMSANFLSDYLFPGTGFSGELKTYQKQGLESSVFEIADQQDGLHIVSPGGTAKVLSSIPKVYSDGAAYLIDGLIQP